MPNKHLTPQGSHLLVRSENSSDFSGPVTAIETTRLVGFGVPFHLVRLLTEADNSSAVTVQDEAHSGRPSERRAVK
jgi:hypothetical protein